MRTKFKPNEKQRMTVAIMSACGAPHVLIMQKITNNQTGKPLSRHTFTAAFKSELSEGRGEANSLVAQSLFKKATGNGPGAVVAAIFWLKTRAGWKEPATDTNLTVSRVEKLTDEELEEEFEELAAAVFKGDVKGP